MLDLIKSNHKDDKGECCRQMFWYWLETTPNATWQQLLDSLKSPAIRLDTIAANIEAMCCLPLK